MRTQQDARMRRLPAYRPTRRDFLKGALIAGGSLGISARAFGEDSSDSSYERSKVLKNTDREGNTEAALSAIDANEPILSIDTAYSLELAVARYEAIVGAGGWDALPRETLGLVAGNYRSVVSRLRKRLAISGDYLAEVSSNDMFDPDLDAALRQFQARHGLSISGKVDPETYLALNIPADYRLMQLRLNFQRVQIIAPELSDRYVVVNIPAAAIEAIEQGQVAQRHNAVVGRIDRQTPILHSKIREINFNPYWHVPKSIIRQDIIKYMNEDPEYLTKYRIKIYDSAGKELNPTDIDWTTDEAVNYAFRQEPGGENSMGHVKINFPNPFDVYLHDTPAKGLFGENRRFHSSGCVRVDGVEALVAWILEANENWDPLAIQAVFATDDRVDVAVKDPAPIHTTYITAWSNRQGAISFRDDVYDFDSAGRISFED